MALMLADRVCSLINGENLAPFPLIYDEMGIGENAMKHRQVYQRGEALGDNGISFVEEIPTKVNELRRALMKCRCGNIFEVRISNIKNNYIKSCGCIRGKHRKIKYIEGQILGDDGIIFIKEVESKNNIRMALFRCNCGKEFVCRIDSIKNKGTKSCGCNISNHERICQECGSEFLGGKAAQNCPTCRTRICKQCGNTFHARWKYSRGWEQCCSKECVDEERKNMIPWNKDTIKYVTIYCKHCNTPMVVKDQKNKKIFCSRSCQGAHWAKKSTLRRSDNPILWRQAQFHTPEYKAWHKEVLVRDSYICRECWDKKQVKNNKNLIAHHIVPIYVDAMKIVDVNNGITLCIKCHKKTLTREAEYSDYYSGLLGLPAPEVGKQLFKTINVFQVLRKLELGHTHKQTAKHFGMSAQTLRTKLFGVVLPPRSYRPKGCTFYTVLKLKVDGNSVRKIAKLLCTTTIKVVGILRLWGITIRHKKAKEKGLTGNIIRKTMHMTVKQLSEYFGVSKMTVSRCRIQYGVI